MGEMTRVAGKADLRVGGSLTVEFNGETVALFNVDGSYYAISDTCTHAGAPRSTGDVESGEVVCPWHGARFSLNTGEALCPPAPGDVTCYRVVVEGDDLKLEQP